MALFAHGAYGVTGSGEVTADVDRAECIHGSSNTGLHRLFTGNVYIAENHATGEFFHQRICLLLVHIEDSYLRAVADKAFYCRATQAGCTTGDYCYFIFQIHINSPELLYLL